MSWIDLALDLVLSEKLTSSKQMNKREAKKRWKIFSTKIAGKYFPVEKVFHRADEFSLNDALLLWTVSHSRRTF